MELARKIGCAAVVLTLALGGCGKNPEDVLPTVPPVDPLPATPPQSQPATDGTVGCVAGQDANWSFVQVNPVLNRVVDVLFVVDTSDSMLMPDKNKKMAVAMGQFLGQIPEGTDYRISVMLAHGGASRYSGALFSAKGTPVILNPTQYPPVNTQSMLVNTLEHLKRDVDEANGEAMLYSLMRSLDSKHLTTIKEQGFYRPEAALSVLLVSDENDICFPPQLNGFFKFPDYIASHGSIEEAAYAKYCNAAGQTPSNFPAMVYKKLVELKGDKPVHLGAITHVDPKNVPALTFWGEEAIGHGLIEFAKLSPGGVLIDLPTYNSYAAALAPLGGIITNEVDLRTQFVLDGNTSFVPGSLTVLVDDQVVNGSFDPTSQSVSIAATDAGKGQSSIKVHACLATP
ncbi:hypothetical protein WDW37_11575 [Bdellovibrionota bacterium FG-1]